MEFSQRRSKSLLMGSSIAFILLFICLCCAIVLILSILKLPEVSSKAYRSNTNTLFANKVSLGKLAELMINMLPEGLAFTLFVPSQQSFERDLKLQLRDCLGAEKMNDTYAILSRVLGFSAVPRAIYSSTVPFDKEIDFDSLSGFKLFISKESKEGLIVNRVRAKSVDVRRGEIVVHVMDGVIMDADFEQSFQEDEE